MALVLVRWIRCAGLDNRAALCLKQQKLEDAEAAYKRSLSIKEGFYGENNIETAKGMHNLAKVYDAQGESRKALPLYMRIAASTSTVPPPGELLWRGSVTAEHGEKGLRVG